MLARLPKPADVDAGIPSEVGRYAQEIVGGDRRLELSGSAGVGLAVIDELVTESKEGGGGLEAALGGVGGGAGGALVVQLQVELAGDELIHRFADEVGGVVSRAPQGEDVPCRGIPVHDIRSDVVVTDAADIKYRREVRGAQGVRLQLGQLRPIAVLDDQHEAVLEEGPRGGLGHLDDERVGRTLEVGRVGYVVKLSRH